MAFGAYALGFFQKFTLHDGEASISGQVFYWRVARSAWQLKLSQCKVCRVKSDYESSDCSEPTHRYFELVVGTCEQFSDYGARPGRIKETGELLNPQRVEIQLSVEEFLENQIVQETDGLANSGVAIHR